jgi:hypothetical protein
MKQVRFNYTDGKVQYSIFLGTADYLNEVMQVIIDKIDGLDLMVNGDFYIDNKKI